MTTIRPMVGQWYLRQDRGVMFEVVSIDESDGTVELQDYDGNLDEVDFNSWFEQDVEAIDPPEDWTGALDVAEPDEADGGDPVEPEEASESDALRVIEGADDIDLAGNDSDAWGESGPEQRAVGDSDTLDA